ncbi:hypothetical protein [Acaryochloris sp. CCMEE 5410]|nr:hypothetical protein [Acaryochloris sp. CCMEE 5410]
MGNVAAKHETVLTLEDKSVSLLENKDHFTFTFVQLLSNRPSSVQFWQI